MAELTRRALYDLVWSKPMAKVAAELSITDIALKKICDRHRVPTPPSGYWAKKNAGQKVRQTLFHATADVRDERVSIHDASDKPALERPRRRARATRIWTPPVAPLEIVHPAVLATANALRQATDSDGAAKAIGPGQCGVRVGPASVERTIWILDGLVRRVEARGLIFIAAESCMVIKTNTDSLEMSLTERIEARVHEPTPEEKTIERRLQRKHDRDLRLGRWTPHSQERAYPMFDYTYTGELALGIKNAYADGSLRRNWRDGKRGALHDQLDKICTGVIAYLAGIKAHRERHERWQEEWRQQEARRERNLARAARCQRRMNFINSIKELRDEAADLKAVLGLLEKKHEGALDAVSRMEAWMEQRIDDIAHRLKRDNINAALKEEKLFPQVDRLGEEE